MRLAGRISLPGLFVVLLLSAAAYEEPLPDDALADDATGAIERVRARLKAQDNFTTGGKYGVVMLAGTKDATYSELTIPLWREYCKRHKMGFWLQKEPLNTDFSFAWSKPRLLMELLPVVKWRYMLVVDANTVPKGFDKPWEFMIKAHMRHKRFNNDEPNQRYIFCPWDCDEEYDSPYEDGACSGPVMSVCIYWSQKPATQRLVKSWYVKRHEPELPAGDDGVIKAFDKMKEHNYENIFYRDVGQDVGRSNSKFVPAFWWSEKYKWNVREQIHEYIKKDQKLSKMANKASKGKVDDEL